MRVIALCPVATCAHNVSIPGMGTCLCGAFLIAKPSPRRKVMDLSTKGPPWRWHADDSGPSTIMIQQVELDTDGREHTYVQQENGFWTPVFETVIKLAPDYRRVAVDFRPWHRELRISTDPRRQRGRR